MKTVIYGAYGAGNLGDDLLLEAALRRYKDVRLIVGFGKPHISLTIPVLQFENFMAVADQWLDEDTQLVFGGGGLFWSVEHITIMLRLFLHAKCRGAQVHILAIGAQGADSAPGAVRDLFMLADSASVRDSASLAELGRCGVDLDRVRQVEDLALGLATPSNRRAVRNKKPVVAINWGDGSFYVDAAWREHAATIFRIVLNDLDDKVEFRYVTQVKHISSLKDSCILAGEMLRVLTGNRITTSEFPKSALDLFNVYGACDCVVAFRFHAIVIAYGLGIPALALYHSKGSKYHSFAVDHGLESLCIDNHSGIVAKSIVDYIRKTIVIP